MGNYPAAVSEWAPCWAFFCMACDCAQFNGSFNSKEHASTRRVCGACKCQDVGTMLVAYPNIGKFMLACYLAQCG